MLTIRIGMMLIGLAVLITTACQSGRIPCPESKFAKLKKSKGSGHALIYTARVEQAKESKFHNSKPKNTRAIGSIDIEEWNCPKPGGKKYLPKSIKVNIRKNLKKLNQQESTNSTIQK